MEATSVKKIQTKANQLAKQAAKPKENPFSNKNNSRQLAWSEEPSLRGKDQKDQEDEDVSYYSENEESEYYDEEEDADKVPSQIIKPQPPSDDPVDKLFDPRKDKLINITTDESNFDQSFKHFQPPLEQPDSSFISIHIKDTKPKPSRTVADANLSFDSIL